MTHDLTGRPYPSNWATDAACNPSTADNFFPPRGLGNRPKGPNRYRIDRAQAADALAACDRCPVRLACLQHALDNNETDGVWGGLTEGELEALREGAA